MKKNLNCKKVTLCILSLVLFLSSILISFTIVNNNSKTSKSSQNSSTYEKLLPSIEEASKVYALVLAKNIKPELELSVTDTIPIYNTTDNM